MTGPSAEARESAVQRAIEHLGRASGCEVGAVEHDHLIGDLLAVIQNRDAALAEARDIIVHLVELSRQAMHDANRDGGEYDADYELADAKLFLARAPEGTR